LVTGCPRRRQPVQLNSLNWTPTDRSKILTESHGSSATAAAPLLKTSIHGDGGCPFAPSVALLRPSGEVREPQRKAPSPIFQRRAEVQAPTWPISSGCEMGSRPRQGARFSVWPAAGRTERADRGRMVRGEARRAGE
jgi:hypothetical protein